MTRDTTRSNQPELQRGRQAAGGNAIEILLYACILMLAFLGARLTCTSGLGFTSGEMTGTAWLVVYALAAFFAAYIKKYKWLPLIPLMIAFALALLSIKSVISGTGAIMEIVRGQYWAESDPSLLETALSRLEDAELRACAITAIQAYLRFFLLFSALAIIRRNSAVALVLCELPFYALTLLMIQTIHVWALLCLLISSFSLYVLSSSRKSQGVSGSIANDMAAVMIQKKETMALLRPKQTALAALSVPLLFAAALLSLMLLPAGNYQESQGTRRFRQTLLQSGFMQLILPWNNGLSDGDITGLDEITFSPDTAIRVQSSETRLLYLRSYAGAVYTRSEWKKASARAYASVSEADAGVSPMNLNACLRAFAGTSQTPVTVSVIREYADGRSVWLPNGLVTPVNGMDGIKTVQDTSVSVAAFRQLWEYSVEAVPVSHAITSVTADALPDAGDLTDVYTSATAAAVAALSGNISYDGQTLSADAFATMAYAYTEYVCSIYSVLPEETLIAAQNLCRQYGLTLSSASTGDGGVEIDLAATCAAVRDLLTDNCTLSLDPKSVPRKVDFATGFLNDTREGYAAHFATTAVVLLRAMGIPARYAEGYLVTTADYSSELDENGYILLSDNHAHAWAEIYDPVTLDWIPFDMVLDESGSVEPDIADPDGNDAEAEDQTSDTASEEEASETPEPEELATPDPAEASQDGDESDASATPLPDEAAQTPSQSEEETPAPEDASDESDADSADEETSDESDAETDEEDGAESDAGDDGEESSEGEGNGSEGEGEGDGDAAGGEAAPFGFGLLLLLIPALLLALAAAGYAVPRAGRKRELSQSDATAAVLFCCRHAMKMIERFHADSYEPFDTPAGYVNRVCKKLPWLDPGLIEPMLETVQRIRYADAKATKKEQSLSKTNLSALYALCRSKQRGLRGLLFWYRFKV